MCTMARVRNGKRMYDAQMNKKVAYDVTNGKSWFPATHLHTLI